MRERQTFVLGDVHLTRHTPADVLGDLKTLLRELAGQRLIVAGDFFDLASDAPKAERRRAIGEVVGAHAGLASAIGGFLEGGGELTLLGGNHDAAIGDGASAGELAELFGLDSAAAARLSARPWFLRDGGLHVEHGHFYDPDNAPAHPLIAGEASLGVHFSAEFIHPTGAHRFLQANDGTPLSLLLAAFRWYGSRAPLVISRYFQAAFGALAKAGPFYRGRPERRAGHEREARFAEDVGVPRAIVEAVLAVGVPSTLESWSATFARLYMDRVAATLALGAGAVVIAASERRREVGVASVLLGAMLLVVSWLNGHNRYGGTVVERLALAADRIARETGAGLVVFGHTHREALGDSYANTGSFSWPGDAPGRPYLEIVERARPRAVRRYLRATTVA